MLALLLASLQNAQPSFAQMHDRFAVELLRSVAQRPGNQLLSPFSVAAALAMAREGAVGATASEIEATLHLPEGDSARAIAELIDALTAGAASKKGPPLYEFGFANASWAQRGYPLQPQFLERVTAGFRSRLFEADFRRDADDARERINDWVSEQTRERIDNMIPAGALTPDMRMVIVNAVYLKSLWAAPFDANRTRPRPFNAPSGARDVPTMHQTLHAKPYGESERAQVLALDYKGGLEMLIVLPKAVDGIAAVLAHESMADWTAKLAPEQIALALPKFQFDNSYDLVPVLAHMGIRAAFDPAQADFTGISPRAKDPSAPLYIGVVRHRSWIAVDELGTEAAAATSLELKVGAAMRPEQPRSFKVDRPFLFFIRQRASGLTLFAGRVDEPGR